MHDFRQLVPMKRSLPPLLALRAFEAAARSLSFTLAAQELNVTQSAISRQVRALENFLQRKLFVRLTRKIELTEEGQAYFQAIADAFGQVEEATAIAIGRRARTVLTVDVLPSLASLWLMPRLSSFWQENKDIEIRIITSTEPINFATQKIDLAIRAGALPGARYDGKQPAIGGEMTREWNGVCTDLLFPDVLTAVCSKRLIEDGPPLRQLADLRGHTLIHTAIRRHAWRDWLFAHDVEFEPTTNAIDCGSYFMSLQAAQDGKGIALVPSVLADSFDPNHRMARPLPTRWASAGEYYLLMPKKRYEERAIMRFREWIVGQVTP